LYFQIIDSQSGANSTIAFAATIIEDGLSIGLKELAARLGWGNDYEDSILERRPRRSHIILLSLRNSRNAFG
jgi:hypothetical protein